MARLTTTLSEPSAVAPASAGRSPSPSTVQDIARVAEAGLGLFQQLKAREGRITLEKEKAEQELQLAEQQQATADIQTDILSLEDERNALLLEDQQLATQVQNITQDGITPDEQEMLNSLEKQRGKLTEARRSGILNPLNFQTRMNALQKQALADVSNLSIQTQINSLFQQGRGRITAPTPTAQKQFESQMDAKYGVGGWSGVDAGREKGKAIYLNQLKADADNDFQTFVGKEASGFMTIADDHVRQMRKSLAENGALRDIDVDAFRAGINSTTQLMLSNVDTAIKNNRANNLPVDPEMAKQARQRILDSQEFYMAFLDKGQEFGDNVMMSQRLANMNSIVDSVNKARNPALGQIATAVAGTGSNGDLLSMAQLVSAPDTTLEAVVQNLPANLRASIDVNTIRTQAAQAVALAIDGIDFKEAAEAGLVNNRLAASVAGIGVRTTDNPVSVDSYLSVFEGVEFNDTESSLDLFNRPDTQNNLKATPKGLQRMPAVAVHMLDNIKAEITPAEAEFLRVQPDGSLRIELPDDPAVRARVGRFSLYTNKLLAKYNDFLNSYSKEIGINKEQLYKDLLLQEEVREEAGE